MRRRPALPLAASLAIHAAAVTLVVALTFSNGIIERPRPTPTRALILLAPIPPVPIASHLNQLVPRTPPRMFRAPVILMVAAPLRQPPPVPAPQIPLPDSVRPLLPSAEVVHLPAAPPPPPPPFRTDNFSALAARAAPASSAVVVTRSSGFEQVALETRLRPRASPVLGGEFQDATMIPARQPRDASIARVQPVTRPVEILSKPRPVYTEEARRQRIEGEVLLQILFGASGQVRVLGTVRGLGHGLDETAIAAAEAIRFRPAERAGVAADSTAIVHIVFQLAF